jgi:hypothetical protein
MSNDTFPAERGRALLIFPLSFYSFVQVIQKAMAALGYDVVVANHEYPNNALGKILGKLRVFWLLEAFTERVFRRDYIANKGYALVVIVKGRGMSTRLLQELHRVARRIVAYNFDSFGYNPAPLRWYKETDKYCTFDYVDADKHALSIVELFSSIPDGEAPKNVLYDVSAIMRNHSNRLRFLDAVLKLWPGNRNYIYIFEQNIFNFVINAVRNPGLYLKYWRNIYFKSLPYNDYVSVLRNSYFTLDYAHPKQSGITVRCFEALSVQTKIITNNRYIKRNPCFNDRNTIVFDGKTGVAEARNLFEKIKYDIVPGYHRTVSDFLRDLLA